ncbi:MAG: hypothetical protein ACI841_000479 [Planctomycetota bacterium]|jgi:hypothetical protein
MLLVIPLFAVSAEAHPQAGENRRPRPELSSALNELFARADTSVDDWESEAIGEEISNRAQELADAWTADSESEAEWLADITSDWVASNVAFSTIDAGLAEFANAERMRPTLESWRPAPDAVPRNSSGSDTFKAEWQRIADWLGTDRSLKLKVVAVRASSGVDLDGATHVTRMNLRATGSHSDEQRQLGAQCTMLWSQTTDGIILLACHLDTLVMLRGPVQGGALFADATGSLLAQDPDAAQRLAEGLESVRARSDRILGSGLLGHHGIAIGDVNGDGLEDLYLPQPGGMPNMLLIADATGGVRDDAVLAGVEFLDMSRSALLLDLDSDNDLDLVVNVGDQLLFLQNNGRGRFRLLDAHPVPNCTSLSAADFDRDGDLDVYACGYVSVYTGEATPVPYHDANNGQPNKLFKNLFEEGGREEWSFEDVTAQTGLDANNSRFSFAAAWEDYDRDGDPDLYVANDFGRNNLYRNEGGRFVDVAREAGVEDISAGMGVSWGDVDGDGWMDLYVSNMWSSAGQRVSYQNRFQPGSEERVRNEFQRHSRGNSLFRNRGDGSFDDISVKAGATLGRWAWGALFVDLDDDPWRDIFVPNGFVSGSGSKDL